MENDVKHINSDMSGVARGTLLKFFEKEAISYRRKAKKSISGNKNSHEYRGKKPTQKLIDAVLTDFINYVASGQGMNYGLKSYHLKEDWD